MYFYHSVKIHIPLFIFCFWNSMIVLQQKGLCIFRCVAYAAHFFIVKEVFPMCKEADEKLEEAFGLFLERCEYDKASAALFGLARAAFIAGYCAAVGVKPIPQPLGEYDGRRQQ